MSSIEKPANYEENEQPSFKDVAGHFYGSVVTDMEEINPDASLLLSFDCNEEHEVARVGFQRQGGTITDAEWKTIGEYAHSWFATAMLALKINTEGANEYAIDVMNDPEAGKYINFKKL